MHFAKVVELYWLTAFKTPIVTRCSIKLEFKSLRLQLQEPLLVDLSLPEPPIRVSSQ